MAVNHPHVTVGMPVYNDPDGLRRSIPSILGQTWPGPLRIIVVDDGSTDRTPDVLAEFAELDPRIEIVRHPRNEGRPTARNRVLSLATGAGYLAWCDSSDLWHPRKLELQLAALTEAEQETPDTPVLCTGSVHWVLSEEEPTRLRIPKLDGDQLHGVLLGTIYPYLQALVGKVAHFHQLGGFDQRLLRRQDYDLLVRFVAEGGRLVSSPQHVPVFTYVKSYTGGSAASVAESNRILREKHRSYYRRYWRELERQVRSNQHRLVARFHEANGSGGRAFMSRLKARFWSPDVTRTARRSVLRSVRLSRSTTRIAVRLLRPMYALLRRAGLVELARRVGLGRALAGTRLGETYRASRAAVGTSPPPPALTDDLRATPERWLELERAYRENGLLDSAERALRQGLEQHPTNPELFVRLVELLPLRRNWTQCVELWTSRGRTHEASARILTYARVARAYRELGNVGAALDVLEEGVLRFGPATQLSNEMYLSRSALVDWPTAVSGSMDATGNRRGSVTSLGFLSGNDGPVEGWITAAGRDTSPVVELTVNGVPIAATSASGGGERLSFTLNCHDLRGFLGDGDVVSVRCDGQPLHIEGRGLACTVTTGYESRFPELRRKLDQGFTFTKFGMFRRRSTPQSIAKTIALHREIATLLQDSWGYPAFPLYGDLLGAIREHDVIAHDIGGFDMGYVSSHQKPAEVRAEFLDVCTTLLNHDYRLRIEPWSVYVRSPNDPQTFVDVNYAWFSEEGELQLSFGWRHTPVADEAGFRRYRESQIGPHVVRVPGNAEAVLEQIYGESWTVPDQGFELPAKLHRAAPYLLTTDEMLALSRRDPDRVEARLDHHPNYDRMLDFTGAEG